MRRPVAATVLLALLSSPAWAEAGRILLAPDTAPVVIDSQRLQGDRSNTYDVSIGGEQDGLLRFELRPNDRTLNAHLRVADPDGGTVMEASADESGKVTRMELPIGPGRYVLEVDDYGHVTRQNPYRLTASFKADTDRCEPNNDFDSAKVLNPGQVMPITLFRFGKPDEDYFNVRHAGGLLKVDVSPLTGVHPAVRVYNGDREEVSSGSAANEGAALHFQEELPAGNYTVVIVDHTESNRPGSVQLTVSSQ